MKHAAKANAQRARMEQRAAELSAMFSEANWAPSTENFEPRPYVTRYGSPESGWWTVAGRDPAGRMRAKSCRSEEEILAFLNEPGESEPEAPELAPIVETPPPTFTSPSADETALLREQLEAAEARAEAAESALANCEARLTEAGALLKERPADEGQGGMEYGPAEVVTEVEPEPVDTRQRLIASDWLKGQMKSGESLGAARNRLLTEYNILLNKNVTASFANDDERIRFRDLTANMTDFSKG